VLPIGSAVVVLGFLLLAVTMPVRGQAPAGGFGGGNLNNMNPPPFDWNDGFYLTNGINVTELDTAASARFGLFRQTGDPAGRGQVNWKIDNSNTSPIHNNVRILATVGGFDNFGNDEYINIIAFLNDSGIFQNTPIGQRTLNIASSFQAYTAPRQKLANGTIATQPCSNPNGTPIVSNVTGHPIGGTTSCFVPSPVTSTERHDKSFDITLNHYFCDDIAGFWIITYFYWLPSALVTPTPAPVAALAQKNGVSLDGTPIIREPNDLDAMEGQGFADEFNLPPDGSQGPTGGGQDGPVWLVCPTLQDATNGAIAQDAFLDAAKLPNGNFQDADLAANFASLQRTGQFSVSRSSPTNVPVISGAHTLTPANATGLRLNDHFAVAANGNPVTVSTANGTAAQNWTFAQTPDPGNEIVTNSGPGYAQVVAQQFYTLTNGVGNFCLDAPGGNAAIATKATVPDGTALQIWTCNGSNEQVWAVMPSGHGVDEIVSATGVDSCMEVAGGGTANQTPVDVFNCNGGSNQQWFIH